MLPSGFQISVNRSGAPFLKVIFCDLEISPWTRFEIFTVCAGLDSHKREAAEWGNYLSIVPLTYHRSCECYWLYVVTGANAQLTRSRSRSKESAAHFCDTKEKRNITYPPSRLDGVNGADEALVKSPAPYGCRLRNRRRKRGAEHASSSGWVARGEAETGQRRRLCSRSQPGPTPSTWG